MGAYVYIRDGVYMVKFKSKLLFFFKFGVVHLHHLDIVYLRPYAWAMAAAGVSSLRADRWEPRRRRRGGVVGCLLFVAAGGRRGRGDLCRCSPTGALKATPGRTPHMRRACRCRRGTTTTIQHPGDDPLALPVPANPTCSNGCWLASWSIHASKWRPRPVDRW